MDTPRVTGMPGQVVVTETNLSLAKRHFELGREYFNLQQFAEAIREFQQAHALSSRPKLLYNIAVCHQNAGQPQEAIHYYQQYLEADPQAEERPEVEERIRALQAQETSAETREMTLWIDPYLEAEPAVAPPEAVEKTPPAEEAPPAEPQTRPYRLAGWITLGAAGVLAAASGASYLMERRYHNQREREINRGIEKGWLGEKNGEVRWPSGEAEDLHAEKLNAAEEKKNLWSNIKLGTGIAAVSAAATGGVLLYLDNRGTSVRLFAQAGETTGFLLKGAFN